ncbi:kinase family [Musa troglodytarum]|uniref:Kinase family n=1 Tax=Musa troglodytarum TaxID=320322 RepID=A0A9E7KJV7_9LILI|nr:kinase family [Musa troglodytarum]
MNPDHSQPDAPMPPVDYFDLETSLSKKFASWARKDTPRVSEIPFQMYAYRVVEREKTSANVKDKCSDSGSEVASLCGDENVFSITPPDDAVSTSVTTAKSSSQNSADAKNKSSAKKANGKTNKQTGQSRDRSTRVPYLWPQATLASHVALVGPGIGGKHRAREDSLEGASGPKTFIHVRQWGAAPSLFVHLGQTPPLCEGNLTLPWPFALPPFPGKQKRINESDGSGRICHVSTVTDKPAGPLRTGPTFGARRK